MSECEQPPRATRLESDMTQIPDHETDRLRAMGQTRRSDTDPQPFRPTPTPPQPKPGMLDGARAGIHEPILPRQGLVRLT